MKKIIFLVPLLLILSCSRKSINDMAYSDVMMGMSEKELFCLVGDPYSTCKNKDGSFIYEYIERFDGYKRKIMQINYFITVKNGVVTHKRTEKSYPPGYMYDSLDYQSKKD